MKEPIKPYQLEGEIWHNGWDIPTNFCIDAGGKIWCNIAHGGPPTHECSLKYILEEAIDDVRATSGILRHFNLIQDNINFQSFIPLQPVNAWQADKECYVMIKFQPHKINAGEWLVETVNKNRFIISKEEFEKTYSKK